MLFKHSVIALAMLITTSSISMVNATTEDTRVTGEDIISLKTKAETCENDNFKSFVAHMEVYYQALMTLEELRVNVLKDYHDVITQITSTINSRMNVLFIQNAILSEKTFKLCSDSFDHTADECLVLTDTIMSNTPIDESFPDITRLCLLRIYILTLINLCYELSITTDTRDSRFTDNCLITLSNFKQLVSSDNESWRKLKNFKAIYDQTLDGLSMVEIFHDRDFSALTFTFGDLLKLA